MGPLLACSLFTLVLASPAAQSDAETRVLDYIREHVRPGQPLLVTQLYNQVFTQPEERQALDKLYNAFFRIPLFVVQYHAKFGNPPKLKTIAEQFDLKTTQAADVLLRVMESDPRVPRFLTRDSETSEITSVDSERILEDPRFGQAVERHLSGWAGKTAPEFLLPGLDPPDVSSGSLRGKPVLLYIWFTGCPPCMKQTPELVELQQAFSARGLTVVGANADKFLGLGYDDGVRRRYAAQQRINFPLVHWTRESDVAFGNISIFPTLFLIDPHGTIVRHWVGYTDAQEIRRAGEIALARPQK